MNDRRKKKKKEDDVPFLIREMEQVLEKTIEQCFFQAMEDVEKEWIKKGGTVSGR